MWKPKAEEKVTLKRTEKLGRVNLAITPCLVSLLTHCYCWTIRDERKRTDGTGRIQFACSGWRKVRDAKLSRVPRDTTLPTWIAIRNVESTVHWEGTGNGAVHFCDGPKERSEVEGKQVRRSVVLDFLYFTKILFLHEEENEIVEVSAPDKRIRFEWQDKEPQKFLMIEGDGNCLYRSISQHVNGGQHQHFEVRKKMMDKLLESRDERWALDLFGTSEEIAQYVALHRKPGEWASSKELAVSAKLFKRNFILYKPQWSSQYAYFSADYEKVDTPLNLSRPNSVIRYSYGHFEWFCVVLEKEKNESH
uniref:OTU domain-containing protein n=1 Tax=Ditylenchus dipsaci TaxID=166011 RepID=A0A915DDI1_9BILA